MTFQDFLTKNNNQFVETEDDSNLDQCFDLVMAWVDALGIPRDTIRHLFAYQIYTQPIPETDKYFELIANIPDAVPQAGDIVVWGKNYNGTAGHTGIATGVGDTNLFECFVQNDPKGSNSHIRQYNYDFVLGWLRSKTPVIATPPEDQVRIDRDRNWNLFIAVTSYLGVTVDGNNPDDGVKQAKLAVDALHQKIADLTKEVGDLGNANTNLKTNISEVEKENTDLLGQLQAVHTSDSTAIDQGLEAEKSLRSMTADMQAVAAALKVTYPPVTNLLAAIDSLYHALPPTPSTPPPFRISWFAQLLRKLGWG